MTVFKKSVFLMSFMLVTSCASVLTSSNQTVNVKAVDAETHSDLEDVKCSIVDGTGATHQINGNPGNVTISRARGNIIVTCSKSGFSQGNVTSGSSFNSDPSFNWVTVGNVLFWPGFIVDGMTGAYKDLPTHLTVSMKKNVSHR